MGIADIIVRKLRSKTAPLVVLLTSDDDDLSQRASQLLETFESNFYSRGVDVYNVDVSPQTSSFDELSCVRVPQLRVFVQGKLVTKLVGPLSEDILHEVLRGL